MDTRRRAKDGWVGEEGIVRKLTGTERYVGERARTGGISEEKS